MLFQAGDEVVDIISGERGILVKESNDRLRFLSGSYQRYYPEGKEGKGDKNRRLYRLVELKDGKITLQVLPVKHKIEGWVNPYKSGFGNIVYETFEKADGYASDATVGAPVHVSFEWEE